MRIECLLLAGVLLLSACSPWGVTNAPASTRVMDSAASSRPSTQPVSRSTPVFAYYYIWFDETSWLRAKIDLPQLGRYSSDDEAVMRQHIRWARESGIDGFIVGWKSTKKLDARLIRLLHIADEQHFKIIIIYQALDFERDPLTLEKIGADLDWLIATQIEHPSLQVFGKPVVIWSGTWKFSAKQVRDITGPRRDKLKFLGSAKSVRDYERIADYLDGNAYYWSSVNIDTHPNYEGKLREMAETIRKRNGLWIAPAAPGFDARLVGGTQTIERKHGLTLRQQMRAAVTSKPDAIGLISWNEFSENSHIEPSVNYDRHYLDVLKDIRQNPP